MARRLSIILTTCSTCFLLKATPTPRLLTGPEEAARAKLSQELNLYYKHPNRQEAISKYCQSIGKKFYNVEKGFSTCGESTTLLGAYLLANGHDVSPVWSTAREYMGDHVFLELRLNNSKNPLIIDSTYKQFFYPFETLANDVLAKETVFVGHAEDLITPFRQYQKEEEDDDAAAPPSPWSAYLKLDSKTKSAWKEYRAQDPDAAEIAEETLKSTMAEMIKMKKWFSDPSSRNQEHTCPELPRLLTSDKE